MIILLLVKYNIINIQMADIIISDFEYNNDERLHIIITNLLNMLKNRNLINTFNDKIVNDIYQKIKKSFEYLIKLDNPDRFNNKEYKIIILNESVDRITSSSLMSSYIDKYPSIHKIIIVDSINKNVELQFIEKNDIEIFTKSYFMIDISQYKYTPKHILLTQEQKNQVYDEYNIPFNKYPKIFITDPMAKYYNARIGDLIKIIRPSSVSGYAVYYRYVISS